MVKFFPCVVAATRSVCADAGLSRRSTALLAALALAGGTASVHAGAHDPAVVDWVRIGTAFEIARTETTVGQFRRFVEATGTTTRAERSGGGEVYDGGWVRMPGWTWDTPFGGGRRAANDEPVVHVTFDEAQAFCRWAGGRLPSDAQWVSAAYTEQRESPSTPFVRGRTYPYPIGDSPAGAQCLGECGAAAVERAVRHGATLSRGHGHARAAVTPPGVNGLYDMGGNVWEWVDEPSPGSDRVQRRTRGGSWWYGAAPMRAEHLQDKPADTAVVYIGFRCVRDR